MRSFVALAITLILAACSSDDGPGGGSCPGSPSGGCEQVVESRDECPSLESVCANVCGASYDCCYCDDNTGAWTTLYLDCAPCPDAGPDAP